MSWISNFMDAQVRREQFQSTLNVLRKEHPTATDQGKTECCKSGMCCWRRPGALAPEDVPAIAAFLKLDEKELFRQFLIVDQLHGAMVLLPRRHHQTALAGQMIDATETFSLESPCVFLDRSTGDCSIHAVKPKACREFRCWDNSTHSTPSPEFTEEKLKELGWDGINPDDYQDDYED